MLGVWVASGSCHSCAPQASFWGPSNGFSIVLRACRWYSMESHRDGVDTKLGLGGQGRTRLGLEGAGGKFTPSLHSFAPGYSITFDQGCSITLGQCFSINVDPTYAIKFD
jgi:hypothetical protein